MSEVLGQGGRIPGLDHEVRGLLEGERILQGDGRYRGTATTAPEQKVEEKNDTEYCTMLLAMDTTGKAFTMVALAKTMEPVSYTHLTLPTIYSV